MYNHFQLAVKYGRYYLTASNGSGHGTHSPFVFTFIEKVLNDRTIYPGFVAIEQRRVQLEGDQTIIDVEDFGAGSAVIVTNKRMVSKIARSSLKPKKYAQLLHRMVRFYQPATIIELGTSFGITSAYLASGKPSARLYTLEGSPSIADIAEQSFDQLSLQQVTLVRGDFTQTLPALCADLHQVQFVFIDGNHRKDPTLAYFNQLLQKATPETIFVLDDIHWSDEMEDAWKNIRQHPAVTLTIDLFFIGIVLINPDFKQQQHFTIRF